MGRRGRNPESVSPGEDARPAGCRPFCLPDMTPEREQRISSVTARRQRDLQVVIENVDDPPPNMRDLKTKAAASAAKWLEIKKWGSVEACVASVKPATIYAATLSDRGRAPWDLDLVSPCAIAVGNEHDGPSDELVRSADGIITIPMQGFVDSFNVSVATSICLAEAMRQRIAKEKY